MSEATVGEHIETFDPAKDLDALFWKRKRADQARVAGAAHARVERSGIRASGISSTSARSPSEMRIAHSPELQAIFDLGNEVENYVLHEIEQSGAEIVQRGRDFADVRYDMSGHVDAKLRIRSWPRSVPTRSRG
jgi:hypothetical protein